jgi:hypothetical protein
VERIFSLCGFLTNGRKIECISRWKWGLSSNWIHFNWCCTNSKLAELNIWSLVVAASFNSLHELYDMHGDKNRW